MSKRNATQLPDSRAAGKRRMGDGEAEPPAADELEEYVGLFEGDGELDDLGDGLGAVGDGLDDELAAELGGGGDADESDSELVRGLERQESEMLESEVEDVGEMPFTDEQLSTADELDFSDVSLNSAQARHAAELIATNSAITAIHFDGHDLPIGDMNEEDELEWDSEEYTDVEAIIIAEILKKDGCPVKRLDLARNQITDQGAKALALALQENSTLEYLNLESNMIGEKGAAATPLPLPSPLCLSDTSHICPPPTSCTRSRAPMLPSLWPQAVQPSAGQCRVTSRSSTSTSCTIRSPTQTRRHCVTSGSKSGKGSSDCICEEVS